ncbi:MAG: PIN domain-containing protein [Chloroflexi bacterium]|nr:PIN domain-containing protein [Chloroflexota bacterium]
MRVVFDTKVVLAGAGWRHEPYACLVLAARRKALPCATVETLDELRRIAAQMHAEGVFPRDPWPVRNWYFRFARLVGAAPLGPPRSRDANDDPFLACALGARAACIVSGDPDLLVLRKPFGVEIITPRTLLSRLIHL